MSDSATPFGTIALGQTDQVGLANALFDAVSPVSLYAFDKYSTAGLVLKLHVGKILINGVVTDIGQQTLSLTASTTNYVQASPATGAASTNTSGYIAGMWPIGRAVTSTSGITTWYDDRLVGAMPPAAYLAKTLPSDANYTLTAAEARNAIVVISGTITAVRSIFLPLATQTYIVQNNCAYDLWFQGASGGAVVVAPNKRTAIFSNGTSFVEVVDKTPAPKTITGNYTLATPDTYLICNGAATITLTLPTASSFPGKSITVKTLAAFTVVSAASNVKPLDTDTAGTAILAATAGKWAELVSDGANWIVMAGN